MAQNRDKFASDWPLRTNFAFVSRDICDLSFYQNTPFYQCLLQIPSGLILILIGKGTTVHRITYLYAYTGTGVFLKIISSFMLTPCHGMCNWKCNTNQLRLRNENTNPSRLIRQSEPDN